MNCLLKGLKYYLNYEYNMTNENWDKFPANIAETRGYIHRSPFVLNYTKIDVWEAGNCIFSKNSNGKVVASLVNNNLEMLINDPNLSSYIINQFTFFQISHSNDRVLWSKDIYNTNRNTERNNPDVASLYYKQGNLVKIGFNIFNPNTLVELTNESHEHLEIERLEMVRLAKRGNELYAHKDPQSLNYYIQLIESIKNDPTQFSNKVIDYYPLSLALTRLHIENNFATFEMSKMVLNLAYFCLCKSIEMDNTNLELYKYRSLLIHLGNISFRNTVKDALNLNNDPNIFSYQLQLKVDSRDAIYKIELVDLESYPQLYTNVPVLQEKKELIYKLINQNHFEPQNTLEDIIKTGKENQIKVFNYLIKRVITDNDVNF